MRIKELIWGFIAKNFGSFNAIRYIEFNIIENWLLPKKKDIILDLACGAGELSKKMATYGAVVIGVDISKKSAKKFMILNKGNASIVVANAEKLPFKSNVFDKIVCNTALQLIYDDIAVLREIYRTLKHCGYVILTVDSMIHPTATTTIKKIHKIKNKVYRYYTIEDIKKKAELTKMEIVDFRYYIHSYPSAILFNLGIMLNWSPIWRVISILFYPAIKIAESIGKPRKGYGLAVKLRKNTDFKNMFE